MEELELIKTEAAKKFEGLDPLPDLVVYREEPRGPDGTPEVVLTRLKDLKEKREEIESMWRREGKTRTYIPCTEEARRMKLQAKLQNRLETKHAEVVMRHIEESRKVIHIDEPNVVKAVPPDQIL